MQEERVLSSAVENSNDPTAVVYAYRKVRHERLERETHEARQIQLRRSGARGANARKTLLQMEEAVKESEAK